MILLYFYVVREYKKALEEYNVAYNLGKNTDIIVEKIRVLKLYLNRHDYSKYISEDQIYYEVIVDTTIIQDAVEVKK